MKEIQELSKQTDFDNIAYHYNGKDIPKKFIGFKGSLNNTRKSRRTTKRI